MARYLRLYACFVRFSVSRAMEFRFDFFFRVVMDVCFYAANLLFYKIVFLHTPTLAGWTEPQATVFVAGFLLIDGIYMTVFSGNVWNLPALINRGDLDYYLVRPVSSLFFLSLREFAANSFLNLLMAAGILAWALARYPERLGAADVLAYLALLLNGVLVHWLLHLLFRLSVFWTHSANGLNQLFMSCIQFVERPDGVFRGWLRRIITTIVPFALVASFPARVLIEGFSWSRVAHIVAVSAMLWAAILLIWRAGLRSYASASS